MLFDGLLFLKAPIFHGKLLVITRWYYYIRLYNIWLIFGWWFGTYINFPYIVNNYPNWRSFRGVETTNHTLAIHHCLVKKMENAKKRTIWLVVWDIFFFHFIYGMSSFPLTFTPSFFKMGTASTNNHPQESYASEMMASSRWSMGDLQDPKMEVPTIYFWPIFQAYVRGYPPKTLPNIWY